LPPLATLLLAAVMRRKLMLQHSPPFPTPSPRLAGWEQMEETFVASSTGEGMEVIDMVQDEDSERLRNSAVKDMLLDLALSLNTGSFVLFLLCVT
uniref:Uncharacterized protein n=1 Tax=Dromaius novaehollandiae TaxID=8790 RepID=A0A8C4K817_DRONO